MGARSRRKASLQGADHLPAPVPSWGTQSPHPTCGLRAVIKFLLGLGLHTAGRGTSAQEDPRQEWQGFGPGKDKAGAAAGGAPGDVQDAGGRGARSSRSHVPQQEQPVRRPIRVSGHHTNFTPESCLYVNLLNAQKTGIEAANK